MNSIVSFTSPMIQLSDIFVMDDPGADKAVRADGLLHSEIIVILGVFPLAAVLADVAGIPVQIELHVGGSLLTHEGNLHVSRTVHLFVGGFSLERY